MFYILKKKKQDTTFLLGCFGYENINMPQQARRSANDAIN